ncbi:MAG: glycosyltransferase family 2 protein [Actinomycetes bacterium]
MPKLSILMPVFNELNTVERAISETLAANIPVERELVIVDDGSTDGTREILTGREWPEGVRVILHDENQGKGAAVRTALKEARGEYSAIMDADLEYDPGDLADLIEPLLQGKGNVAYGVRAFDGSSSHSFLYVMGNRGVTLACNVLFNVYLRDIMTCHKMIRTEIFQSLELRETGFAIEPEITARLIQRGERITELPVYYAARATSEGKKLTSADGFRTLRTLARCRITGGGKPSAPAPILSAD